MTKDNLRKPYGRIYTQSVCRSGKLPIMTWKINVVIEGCDFVFVYARYNFFYGIPFWYFQLNDFYAFVVSIGLVIENWVLWDNGNKRWDCYIANQSKWCTVNRLRINYIKFSVKTKTCLNLNVGYNKEISWGDKRKNISWSTSWY